MATGFLTDANAYDLVSRPVESGSFAGTFVPVDSQITIKNSHHTNSFKVWNDRPQAGSVHPDKSIKLLVQRAITTNDSGGIADPPHLPEGRLTLNFQLMAYKGGETLGAQRQRSLLALSTQDYSLKTKGPSELYRHKQHELVKTLGELKVS